MSETYRIEIRAIEGSTIDLVCTTLAIGGVNDLATTRSFAWIALLDGLPYGGQRPLQVALAALSETENPPLSDEGFHRRHVAKFIASTELIERDGIIEDEEAWWRGREADGPDVDVEFPLHSYVLRVHMTEPRWLEGLAVGTVHGTASLDVWRTDLACPDEDQLEEVNARASRWPAG
jgi:hypothetical protein